MSGMQARRAAAVACRIGRCGRLQADTEWSTKHISELEHLAVPPSWPSLSSKHGQGRAAALRAGVTARRWMGRVGLLLHDRTVVNSRRPPPSAPALTAACARGRGAGRTGHRRRTIADATGENQLKLSKSELNWEEEWSFGEDSSLPGGIYTHTHTHTRW